MGEIKQKLAKEATADKAGASARTDAAGQQPAAIAAAEAPVPAPVAVMPAPAPVAVAPAPAPPVPSSVVPAPAPQAAAPAAEKIAAAASPAAKIRKDEMSIVLKPDQGAEVKLQMRSGAKANYNWSVEGGAVNFDKHGDGADDNAISYEKGRGVDKKEGVMEAAFDGIHGWYWRNRGKADVTVTLRTQGDYSAIQRTE
jgi:hypothetical protein